MDDTPARRFFLQPTADSQRLYEALRAVFVEGGRQKDVAGRFGYDYAAFRQQVTRFRARCAAGQPPPLSPHRRATARRPPAGRGGGPIPRRSPTAAPWAWPPAAAPAPAWRACSSSYRCWPNSGSTTSSARPATPARAWCPPPLPCWACWC